MDAAAHGSSQLVGVGLQFLQQLLFPLFAAAAGLAEYMFKSAIGRLASGRAAASGLLTLTSSDRNHQVFVYQIMVYFTIPVCYIIYMDNVRQQSARLKS